VLERTVPSGNRDAVRVLALFEGRVTRAMSNEPSFRRSLCGGLKQDDAPLGWVDREWLSREDCAFFVPELDRYFLPVPSHGNKQTEVTVYEPIP
jgi:hypothetical protein